MKKKQGYALGSLLLGAASWLCLLGLRRIEKRMKKKQENDRKPHREALPRCGFLYSSALPISRPAYAFRIFRCNRMRSAIMAMNSLLVGFPFVLETVYPK